MNRAYRQVWSAARGAYVIAPETARGKGKAGRAVKARAALAALAGLVLGLSDASAQVKPATTVVPVPGKTNAYLAPNGVPVVDINTANGAGVSHNQFTRYNVDAKGLVINNGNSAQLARQSQLAGQVMVNINLGAEAKVILNEVVAPNRSTLAGYTEVLGGRADVIVANPYGITCAGCGFINSDRVTLTTGAPVWGNDGSVYGFNVTGGDILVNGGGINASGQQILDLVTRAIRIDGQVNTAPGGMLGIVTGANTWAYASREVTASGAAQGAAPAYAIDSSALGGMYAGRIRLIATEAGVGVRMLGEAAASVDDFKLDAAGKVLVQSRVSAARDLHVTQRATSGDAQLALSDASLSAARDLALTANGGVAVNEGLLKAGNNLALQGAGLVDTSTASAARSAGANVDVNITGTASLDGSSWGAGGRLNIDAGAIAVGATGTTLYSGSDAARADRTLSLTGTGDVAIERARITGPDSVSVASRAGSLRLGAGVDMAAAADLSLAAKNTFENAGSVLAGRNLALEASEAGTVLAASNRGLMQASARLDVGQAASPVAFSNSAGARVLADGVGFASTTLDNSGTIQATRALDVNASGAVANRTGGTMLNTTAGQSVNLSAASLDNAGVLQSAGAMHAGVAGASVNSGSMLTTGAAEGGSDGALILRGGSLANSGTIAAAGTGTITTASDLDNTKRIQANSLALTVGGLLANRGADAVLLSGTGLSVNAGAIDNSGTVQAEKALLLDAAKRLANSGVLHSRDAGGHLALRAGTLANSGTIQGAAAAELRSTVGALDNSGQVLAGAGLDVNAATSLNNTAGAVVLSGGALRAQGADIVNAGTLQAETALTLGAANSIDNSGLAQARAADAALSATAASVANSGKLQSAGKAGVTAASGAIVNSGEITAAGALDLRATAALSNAGAAAVLQAGASLDAQSASFDNVGAVQAQGSLGVTATGLLANSGVLQADAAAGTLALRAGSIANSGTVQAAGTASLAGTGGAIDNSGKVVAVGTLDLDAAAALNNRGANAVLLSDAGLGARAASVDNSGTVQGKTLVLATTGTLANSAALVSSGGDLDLQGAAIANAGTVQSAASAVLASTAGAIDNSGKVLAVRTLDLTVATALRNHGTDAALIAGAALGARAASVDNRATVQGSTLAITATGLLDNRATLQSSAAGLALHAGAILNTGAVQAATNAVLTSTNGAIDNVGQVLAGGTLDLDAAAALSNHGAQAALLADGALRARAASVDNRAMVQGATLSMTTGALDNRATLRSSAGNLALQAGTIANSGAVQAAGNASLAATATAGAVGNSGKILAEGDIALAVTTALDNTGAASQIIAQGALAISGGNGFGVTNDGRIQALGNIALGSAGRDAATLRNNASGTIFGNALTLYAATTANRGRIQSLGAGTLEGATLSNYGSSSVVLFGIDNGNGNIRLSGSLHNEGAMHANGDMHIGAARIVNTDTAGMSSLRNLTLVGNGGGIDNAGAFYAGATLATRAPGQTITNAGSGTMDATDIAIQAATFTNYNTVIATHDTGIETTLAFNNLPTGRVPNVVTGPTSYGPVTTPYDSGDIECNIWGAYCNHLWVRAQEYTVTQVLDGPEPTRTGQIIAGNAINLKYGQAATNSASLISAPTVNIEGSGAFTNTDLHLDRITYARRWRIWKTDSTFGSLNYDYRYPTTESDFDCNKGDCYAGHAGSEGEAMARSYALETGRSTYKTFSAGIYAGQLNFAGGSLRNLGSPYQRSTSATSVAGAGAVAADAVGGVAVALQPGTSLSLLPGANVSLRPGSSVALQNGASVAPVSGAKQASVPAANGITFTGLNLNTPTNPNGYFVPAKSPTATYLVEANPLFAVGSNFVGSDYLSVRLGLNPDTVQKRLGDANYEAKLIRDQLVAQTGNNIIKGQKNEAAQMQALMDSAARSAGLLGLNFGQPLTADQAAGLTEDMVWMVEQVVNGQKVLVPVVYLAKNTRDSIESGGPVIAATNANIKTGTLENRGGTIAGDKLTITAEGDVRNTGGKIKGGDVSVTSTKGSIINETVADTNGGKNFARTVIGAAGSIESTGTLNLDAKKDITVTGADIKAGGDARLAAGGNVTFDTIQDKRADSSATASQGLWGLESSSASTRTATSTNIGSNLQTGGSLAIKSGGDTTIAGSAVKVGGSLDLDAAGSVNIISRQDTKESNTTTSRSGLGVGDGLYGVTATGTDTFKGRNVGSTLEVGGDANIAAGKTLTLQGSKLKVVGDAAISAEDVQVLAGQDVDRTTTSTTTTSFLKMSASGDSNAGAGADSYADSSAQAKSKKGSASASAGAAAGASAGAEAGASANVGLTLAETTSTNALDYKSRAVGSELDIGGGLKITAKKDIVLQGATVNSGGETSLKGGNVKILASQDIDISTSKTTTTSVGLYIDSTNNAQAGASAEASAGAQANTGRAGSGASASAQASAQAGASASSDTTIDLVRTSTTETSSLDIRNTGTTINAGGKLKIEAQNKLLVQGSDIGGEQGVSLKAKDMAFTAAEDVSVTTTTTKRTSAGLYVSGDASADAHASAGAGAMANQDSGQTNGGLNAELSAGVSAQAKGGVGVQARHSTEKTVDGSTTAKVSTIRSGSGDIERTAESSIVDVGTAIDAAGDFTQSATTIESRAAKNTTFSSAESTSDSMRLGVYGQANASAGVSASASAEAGSGMFGPGAGNSVNTKAEAGASASVGIEMQYAREQSSSSSNSSKAVVSTIRAGGKAKSTSTGKTTFEGTQIAGEGGVELVASEIDFKAAANTESSSESGLSVNAKANVGLALGSNGAVDAGLGGGFEKGSAKSSSSTAVAGSIQSGGNLVIKTQGDARFEGTDIGAAGDASIAAGGKLAFDAAKNTSSQSSNSANAEANLSLSKSKSASGSESSAGLEASGGFAKEKSSSSEAVTGKIASGGNLKLSSGSDMRFEGTAVQGGGDTEIDAGGKVAFDAARNTSSSESTSLSASLSLSKSSSSDSAKGTNSKSQGAGIGIEGGYASEKSSEAVAGSLESGGNLRIKSGGSATFEGTDIAAGGKAAIDAGGDVKFKAAESTSESVGVAGSLGVAGSNTTTSGPKAAEPGAAKPASAKPANAASGLATAATGAASPNQETTSEKARSGSVSLEVGAESSSEKKGGSLKAGGGIAINSGGNASFEGTQVKSDGDIAVAAKGDVTITTATSKSSRVGLGIGAEGEKSTNSDPAENSHAAKGGFSVEAGSETTHENATFASGGKLTVVSDGRTSLVNAELKADGGKEIAAAGGVSSSTVRDSESGFRTSASAQSESEPKAPAPEPALAAGQGVAAAARGQAAPATPATPTDAGAAKPAAATGTGTQTQATTVKTEISKPTADKTETAKPAATKTEAAKTAAKKPVAKKPVKKETPPDPRPAWRP